MTFVDRRTAVIVGVLVVGLFTFAYVKSWRLQASADAEEPAREYEVGPSWKITKKIRAGLRGTSTRCDEGPPTAEERERWMRTRKPRALAGAPMKELLRSDGTELVGEIYSRLLDELYDTGFGAMTRNEQNTYLTLTLQGEVFNGGFQGFFLNPSGNCAVRTRTALAEMGMGEAVAVVSAALAVFPGGTPPEDRYERNVQMERLPDEYEAWSGADDRFYELDIDGPLERYIRRNSEQFTPPAYR